MTTQTNNQVVVASYAMAIPSNELDLKGSSPPPIHAHSEDSDHAKQQQKKKNGRIGRCGWAVLIGTFLFVGSCFCYLYARKRRLTKLLTNSSEPEVPALLEPLPECTRQRIRITEICNVPDLDDDIFGSDTTMDIKILVDDERYWPKDTSLDCSSIYGSYQDSCLIPDSTLVGCYTLQNSIALDFDFDSRSDDTPAPKDLKITIYDNDSFTSDEFIDILVPMTEWFAMMDCEGTRELEFPATDDSSAAAARVKMLVSTDFDDVGCGADMESLQAGLTATAVELETMSEVLRQYVSIEAADDNGLRGRRQLLFPALLAGARVLVSGVSSFGRLFSRGGGSTSKNILSTLADFTTIGSTWFSSNTNGSNGQVINPGLDAKRQEELFRQVFSRFDVIDGQLDDISLQLQEGFTAMELVVQEEFAKQELDEWINQHLSILSEDYRAYLNPNHTPETRLVYETVFRNSCRIDHSPYTIFQVLYSHACQDCNLLGGRFGQGASQQYLLDTFVNIANADYNTASVQDRVLWFRQSFGVLLIGALTEALYLHSVCLYQSSETVCQTEDPVWKERLEEMGQALEEIAISLTSAELRLDDN